MWPLALGMRLLIPYACTNLKKYSCNLLNSDAHDVDSNSILVYSPISDDELLPGQATLHHSFHSTTDFFGLFNLLIKTS